MTPAATTLVSRTVALLMCTAAAGALTGCKPGAQQAAAADAPPPLAALPLTGDEAPQVQPGPVAVDLPFARPAPLGPLLDAGDGYAYLDRAYVLNDAFAQAPPDFTFDYADEAPWVWRTDDGFVRMVEFLPYGVRYYYYEPGEDYPFLISDPDYGYAFADGDLVAIYDRDGSLLPPEDLAVRAPLAGRELARAESMFRASHRAPQAVTLASWTARRGQVAADLSRWRGLERHQPAWRTYHQQHLASEQAHFAPERFRRAAETVRLDRQIHDPDGADHAMRVARQAQDIARRAHVNIAMAPRRGPAVGPNAAAARMAMAPAGAEAGPRTPGQERRLAMIERPGGGRGFAPPQPHGLHLARAPPGRMAGAGRPERLAMAQIRAGPRAQFDVRDHAARAGPAAFAGPPRFHPPVEAQVPRPQPSSPHLRIVEAAPGGGGFNPSAAAHANPGGGHPDGGGPPHPPPPRPDHGKHR
jgi:transposase-like protein